MRFGGGVKVVGWRIDDDQSAYRDGTVRLILDY